MRIVLVIFSVHENVLHLENTLTAMGHEVRLIISDDYHFQCSYFAKKIDKLGMHGGRERYNHFQRMAITEAVCDWQPDRVLFIETPKNIMSIRDMQELQKKCHQTGSRLLLWIVDVIARRDGQMHNYYQYFDRIFVFEDNDRKFLQDKFGVESFYCPVGYNHAYELKSTQSMECQYDIFFVGAPYKNRMEILEKVAAAAEQHGWKLGVYGPFYDKANHFWKNFQRKQKYPHLFKFVHNGRLTPEKVAVLYNQSRICLNIHNGEACGMNPRTFEIMAAGAFEIIDERDFYDKVVPGKHLETFRDAEELVEKIGVYLDDDARRLVIAKAGHELACKEYRIEQSLDNTLK